MFVSLINMCLGVFHLAFSYSDLSGFLRLGWLLPSPFYGSFQLLSHKYFLMPFIFVFFFWDSYDLNGGTFNIVPEVSEVVFISFNSFFIFPLCFVYLHHSIFHLTYPIFCLSYSTVGSLQSIFDLSYYLIHYWLTLFKISFSSLLNLSCILNPCLQTIYL